MRNYSLFLAFLIATFMISCSESTNQENVQNENIELPQENNKNNIEYSIPSPVDLYILLKSENIPFKSQVLSKIDSDKKYLTSNSKSINFGFFASDLAYCAVLENPNKAMEYFKATKTLADELGLSSFFDENIATRLEGNALSPDSILFIVSESYYDAIDFLNENNKTEYLPFIIAGGWIEGLNILINSVENQNNDDLCFNKILEQSMLLENLIMNIENQNDSPQTQELVEKLNELYQIFLEIETSNPDGLDSKGFDKIKSKVLKIKNSY